MEHRKVKDEEDLESRVSLTGASPISVPDSSKKSTWKFKIFVICALTILTSSQTILIRWSKKKEKYEYSVTTSNLMVEALKCGISLMFLWKIRKNDGVTEDNMLKTTFNEIKVYPIPAMLYMAKNLLQYYIFAYVDAPGYQILKNLNIISTGVLYHFILKKNLTPTQWVAFVVLAVGCINAQMDPSTTGINVSIVGWIMAIIMALLSGLAGVYTEKIMKNRVSRNINVQNFWLYVFGMLFNLIFIIMKDFDDVIEKGFFHGYSYVTFAMIINHAFSGLAVSAVIKYADNIVKVYSTSVAIFLTAFVSVYAFEYTLTLPFYLGTILVTVAMYLHNIGKPQPPK
ncbi:hypothetical protein LUZ60_008832 [Juncus effusus]|nr:hypothetical protein LUZ60_008832 [Juncus effusus]